ncbi:MAG: cation transporter [Bacteroidia bacterium]|nr:cation transporter [Bacteroidia bacterium]
MKLLISMLLSFSVVLATFAQKDKQSKNADRSETTFEVWGNCNMCKKTIEKAARIEGVKSAVWNKGTHKMHVIYHNSVTSPEKVQQAVAKSGYDTELYYGDEESYKNLHTCCQYKRKPKS